MARDQTIRIEKLIAILESIDSPCRVGTNAVGNLMLYGKDCTLGYIDLVDEAFWPKFVSEVEDESVDWSDVTVAGSRRRIADAVSRFATSRQEERLQ